MTEINPGILRTLVIGLVAVLSMDAHGEEKAAPCADDPAFHQQDFALGSWDVYSAEKKVAEALLETSLGGCAIRETWIATNGTRLTWRLGDRSGDAGNGLGLFAYSRLLKSWSYFWVSDTGWTTIFTDGALQSHGVMLYSTEAPLKDGGKRLRHWSLTLESDGAIRERAVGTDDGKKWNTEYELLWRRKR